MPATTQQFAGFPWRKTALPAEARVFVLGAVIAATVGYVAAYVVHVHFGAAPTVADASSEASLAQPRAWACRPP